MLQLVKSLLIGLSAAIAGCSSDNTPKRDMRDGAATTVPAVGGIEPSGGVTPEGTGTGTNAARGSDLEVVVTDEDPEKDFKPDLLSDDDAIGFLKKNCKACHTPGTANDSAWPMGAESDFTKAKFGSDPFAPAVYATLGNKFLGFKDTESSPKPMPPAHALDLDYKKQVAGVLLWMKANFEVAATDGEERLGGPLNLSGPKVSTRYKCSTPPTKSQFMRRVFNDLFDRSPTAAEKGAFYADAEASDVATGDFRTKLLDQIFLPKSPLNSDFLAKGLRKFSDKVSGSTGLLPSDLVSADKLVDLKKEFLQLLLKYVETKSFKDILLMNKVQVTKNTASLYGPECSNNAPASGWAECDLNDNRSNFFGTVGFLSLWRSSFLRNNNNYTRIAHMYTVLSGEALKPKTTGPTGDTTEVNPALACMKSDDNRGRLSDATNPASALLKNGTLAIPQVGAYCQSCHIGRNLANGSIVFRKFGLYGEEITKEDITSVTLGASEPNPKPEYYDQVKEAADVGRVFIDKDKAGEARQLVKIKDAIPRLAALLDVSPTENKGCIVNQVDGHAEEKEIRHLSDLVGEIIGDGKILVQGLGRHIPRAFGNQSLTNQEILSALSKAYTDGEGKLYPLFEAYLKTESYACLRGD